MGYIESSTQAWTKRPCKNQTTTMQTTQTEGKQRANKWEPAKGVIDRKLTKDVKHDIILKKLYQQYLKHM